MAHNNQKYKISHLIERKILAVGDGYRAKNEELGSKGIPFVRAGNINYGFNFDNIDYFPQENIFVVGEKISHVGDVVFTSKGSVGRFSFVTSEIPQFVYSPQLCYWRVLDQNIINPHFLFYWMQSREFFLQYHGVKGQTDMADFVSLSEQRRMYISLPPLSQQHAIARVLGSLDDKIELNRKMNTTLEEIARTLFKSWFIDFDPVHAKAAGRAPAGMDAATAALFPDSFEEVQGRMVPKAWEVKGLDEIATFLNGLALQKYPAEGDDFLPVIKIAQMRKGHTEGSDKASPNIPQAYIIENGDVLFSWSGSLEVMLWYGGRGALNQHLFKVFSDRYPKWFYYLWVLHFLPEFQFIAAGKVTTMGHIQRHHLAEARVVIPPPNLMKATDGLLQTLFEQLANNYLQSQTLIKLQNILLPKLMSGEIRVRDAERFVEEQL